MLALLFLGISLFFGFTVCGLLPLALHKVERAAWGTVLGIAGSSWITALFSFILPYSVSILLGMVILLASGILIVRKKSLTVLTINDTVFRSQRAEFAWYVITVLASIFFFYLFYTRTLLEGSGGVYTHGAVWSDIAAHMNLTSWFASQPNFSWEMPIGSGATLTYPFIFDFFSGMLYRLGFTMRMALFIPGLLVGLSFIQLFLFATVRIFKSWSAAILALVLFLFSGNYGGFWLFLEQWKNSGRPFWQFLKELNVNYSHQTSFGLELGNSITDFIMPQRTILLGFALFLIFIVVLKKVFESTNPDRRLLVFLALTTAFLPFIHFHTFVVCGLLWLVTWIVRGIHRKNLEKTWLWYALPVLIVSLGQVWWQIGSVKNTGYSHWFLGWMRAPTESLALFWWHNGGPLIIFMIIAPYLIARFLKDRFVLTMYWVVLAIFIFCNLYILHPNPYDNMKLMNFTIMVACMVLATCVVKAVKWRKGVFFPILAILISMCGTGFLTLYVESKYAYQFESNDDIALAQAVRENSRPEDVILTGDRHNHPVYTLSGRKIVMGYRGWLNNFGIPFQQLQQDVASMYAGTPETPVLLKKYSVDYITIGPGEVDDYSANLDYFNAHYPVVYQNPYWILYRVEGN